MGALETVPSQPVPAGEEQGRGERQGVLTGTQKISGEQLAGVLGTQRTDF